MAHRYRIEPSLNLLIAKFEGKMGWHDVLEGIVGSTKDPEFRQGMDVIGDLRDSDTDFRYEGASELASEIAKAPGMKFGRFAAVAPESFQFGLARMFGALADDKNVFVEFRVFSDFAKAGIWLGLPEDLELRL